MQGLQHRIVYPKGFNRPYRCVVQYCQSYTLEETSNLIWIGSLIAYRAPAGFRKLWGLLQPALVHYLYGRDGSERAIRAAARSIQRYAEELEKFVIAGWVRSLWIPWPSWACIFQRPCIVCQTRAQDLQWRLHATASDDVEGFGMCAHGFNRDVSSALYVQVPDRMLPPNLHIAVCRFVRQELQRGLIALDPEWWVERGMNGPKLLARRALYAEMTWIKATQSITRALLNCKVQHGCVTPAEAKQSFQNRVKQCRDPAAAAEQRPYCTFAGTPYRNSDATLPSGLPNAELCAATVLLECQKAKQRGLLGWKDQDVVTWDKDSFLTHVAVTTFRKCQLQHCIASSPLRGDGDRVTASSWFEAKLAGASALVQVLSFVLVELKAHSSARPLRLAIVNHCQQWVRDDLAGAACYIAPAAAEAAVCTTAQNVARLKHPCVLIKPSSADFSELRLMPLYDKVL